MKIEEIKQTAAEKTAELQKLVEDAYQAGYQAAMLEHGAKTIQIEGVEYYDLGLSSGTLWSAPVRHSPGSSTVKKLCFDEAKHLNIPTAENWAELKRQCRFLFNSSGTIEIVGKNGVRIYDYYYEYEGCQKGQVAYWLKAEPDANGNVVTMGFNNQRAVDCFMFSGFCLPFFLVKNKKDL